MAERKVEASSAVKRQRSTASKLAWVLPASMREKSSRALTSFSRRTPLRCATETSSRFAGRSPLSGLAKTSSSGLSIKVNGVRNSWLTLEKNAVFARSISASASARRRSSS